RFRLRTTPLFAASSGTVSIGEQVRDPRHAEPPAPPRSRGRRRPRRSRTMRIKPKVVLATVGSLAFVIGVTAFVVDAHIRNTTAKVTPLTLDEMMRMAKDPFAPDPEEDAIK